MWKFIGTWHLPFWDEGLGNRGPSLAWQAISVLVCTPNSVYNFESVVLKAKNEAYRQEAKNEAYRQEEAALRREELDKLREDAKLAKMESKK